MASVQIFKLKTVFFLVITLYFLVGLIALDVFRMRSQDTSHLPPHQSISRNDYQLLYQEQARYQYLRKIDVPETTEELDYHLNVRKLILFAVHELNEPLKYTRCTKWWANPLDLIVHEAKSVSTTHTDHLIRFHIQPGNLELEVIIRQQVTTIGLEDKELEIQSTFKIQDDFSGKHCGEDQIGPEIAKFCLCDDSEHFEGYNAITNELRNSWNSSDTELVSWHPDYSYFVTDYMNLTDYEWFVTSPGRTTQDIAELGYSTEYCGTDIKMVVMISSAPGHFEQRRVIRETFASPSNLEGKGMKVVFLMGIPEDKKLNDDVKLEAAKSKDIIQANFRDSYHNLTISHLSMYKWAHLTCIGGKDNGVTVPPYIFKADDDFFLNLDLALYVAQQNSEYEFIGCLYCGTKAIRELSYMYKYYTPRYMHISYNFGGYVSGVAYTMRTDIIPLLLHMSKTTPIVHMDDAYVSGILLRQIGIQPRNSDFFSYVRNDIDGELDACKSKQMASSYVLDPDDMTKQWKMFLEPMPPDCNMEDLKIEVPKLSEGDVNNCYFKHT